MVNSTRHNTLNEPTSEQASRQFTMSRPFPVASPSSATDSTVRRPHLFGPSSAVSGAAPWSRRSGRGSAFLGPVAAGRRPRPRPRRAPRPPRPGQRDGRLRQGGRRHIARVTVGRHCDMLHRKLCETFTSFRRFHDTLNRFNESMNHTNNHGYTPSTPMITPSATASTNFQVIHY